jgi:hypothetical protein
MFSLSARNPIYNRSGAHTDTHTHTHKHININTHTHTHTHTHKQAHRHTNTLIYGAAFTLIRTPNIYLNMCV